MWGRATLQMEESSTSMKVARVTVMATIQGLMRGRHGRSATRGGALGVSSSWRVAVAISLLRFYGELRGFTDFCRFVMIYQALRLRWNIPTIFS